MSEKPPLNDEQVYDALYDAWLKLSSVKGASQFGETALATARKVLVTLQLALVRKTDEAIGQDEP